MISPIGEEEKSIMNDFEQNLDLVNNNSKDLLDLCRNYSLNPSLLKNIQMKLSGCLNAFVNGGLSLILPVIHPLTLEILLRCIYKRKP